MESVTGNDVSIVATATLTRDQVQRSVLQTVLADDENRQLLEGQNLVAHYQFNPHHRDAFCLVTLTRTSEQPQELQDDDQEEAPSEEFSSDVGVLTDDD